MCDRHPDLRRKGGMANEVTVPLLPCA
ncbi:hypothetical protein M2302_001036, partial [Micromonospora sp. A200]|nr:hypothetical protein [Micromonospora sp. A200]